jgi:hypothetical protein
MGEDHDLGGGGRLLSTRHLEDTVAEATENPIEPPITRGADDPAPAPSRLPIPPARLRNWLVVSDTGALMIALLVAVFAQDRVRPVPDFISTQQLRLAAFALPLWLMSMGFNRLFTARTLVRRSEEFRRLLCANLCGTGFVVALGFVIKFKELSRLWVGLMFVSATLVLTLTRSFARRVFSWM